LRLSEQAGAHQERTAALLAIRTRFLDDLAQRAADDGIRQVVVLAAGMDARAFRLAWPARTTLYELDHRELLEDKEAILVRARAQAACRRVPVAVDLRRDWTAALLAAGFAVDERSLWLAEGLLYYLTQPVVDRVLRLASRLAVPGSMLGADLVSAAFLTSEWTKPALAVLARQGFAWLSGTDEPEALVAEHGWVATVRQPGEAGASYDRWPWPVVPRDQRQVPQHFLVAARRLTVEP
jgi:methyltransferase (TIGR00027 family)